MALTGKGRVCASFVGSVPYVVGSVPYIVGSVPYIVGSIPWPSRSPTPLLKFFDLSLCYRTLQLVRKGKAEMGWQPMSCLMQAPAKKDLEGFIPFAIDNVASLAKQYSLCVGGEALAELIETGR